MLTPDECGQVAELSISVYCATCQCETPDDIRKAGEMLISKMARGIEKTAGNTSAVEVLNWTIFHVAKLKGSAS